MNLRILPMAMIWCVTMAGLTRNDLRAEKPQMLGAADLDPVTVQATPKHDSVVLVADGEAKAVIHAAKSDGVTNKLLREMQDAIAANTGAKLEIVRQAPDAQTPAIVVGDSEGSRAAGIEAGQIPIEGFVIKTAPNRVFLVGSTEEVQGADNDANAWAIADFLERHVGVRWWWPLDHHGRTIESTDSLTIEPVHYEDAPAYRMRKGWPPFYNGTPYGTLRVNDLYDRLRGGNSWPIQLVVHQPRSGQWQSIYGEDRPEIFAERADGSRNFGMFDYAHPQTLETFLENIELYKTASDEQRKTREFKMKTSFIKGRAITVSPPDMGVHSESEYSQKLLEPEKGGFASASKLMGLFVRDLALEVQKRYPDMVVLYLPYVNYTLAPEGIAFPDNVEVQLCGMPGVAIYKQPELNKQFQGNIDRWAELTARPVQTWDYSCWPTDRTKAPFQYPNVLKGYYQANREQVAGTFINGGISDEWIAQHFTMYCWMKLMWDPAFDVDAAADSFANRMFGPAAEPIRELLRLQTERWEDVVWEVDKVSPTALYEQSYTEGIMDRMAELLDEARAKAADDEVLEARVAYYAQPFDAFFEEAEQLRSGEGLRHMVAKKVPDNPVIDGKLDDQWWDMAEPVVGFETKRGETVSEAKYNTKLRVVWTLEGVTFGLEMHEPNPDALKMDIKTRDDGALWPKNDNVEIFVDVTGQKLGRFWQWLITPANTVMDLRDDRDNSWDPEAPKHATHIGKDYWSVELYLPNSMFEDVEDFQKPATGARWAAQFTRHRLSDFRSDPESLREYSRLNNKLGGFSRNVSDFGLIQFVE